MKGARSTNSILLILTLLVRTRIHPFNHLCLHVVFTREVLMVCLYTHIIAKQSSCVALGKSVFIHQEHIRALPENDKLREGFFPPFHLSHLIAESTRLLCICLVHRAKWCFSLLVIALHGSFCLRDSNWLKTSGLKGGLEPMVSPLLSSTVTTRPHWLSRKGGPILLQIQLEYSSSPFWTMG